MRRRRSLWVVLGLFAVAVLIVDPLREVITDDDFAYARMVEHLLRTGEYRLHEWSAASMPVQIYWGALLSRILGYSFATLRISTLVLLAAGAWALYELSRDQGLSDADAAMNALVLVSSPLVVFLGFTFMTDVPFLAWLTIAAWLYARALQRASLGTMAAASMAGAAAIGTRQFGVALLAGLFGAWASDRERGRRTFFYLAGCVLPVAVAVWQLASGWSNPTVAQAVRLREQAEYGADLGKVALQLFWRPTIVLQYLALFLWMLVPLFALRARELWGRAQSAIHGGPSGPVSREVWLARACLAAWLCYVAGGAAYGYVSRGLLMPALPYLLPRFVHLDGFWAAFLTAFTVIAGGLIGWLISSRVFFPLERAALGLVDWFMLAVTLGLFAIALAYVQLADEYLLMFLPFVLMLTVGRLHRRVPWGLRGVAALGCVLSLMLGCQWTRDTLEEQGAFWDASEWARAQGAAPLEVAARWPWHSYHGAFDRWIETRSRAGASASIDEYFGQFLEPHANAAKYLVAAYPALGERRVGRVVHTVTYHTGFFNRERHDVLVLRRAE